MFQKGRKENFSILLVKYQYQPRKYTGYGRIAYKRARTKLWQNEDTKLSYLTENDDKTFVGSQTKINKIVWMMMMIIRELPDRKSPSVMYVSLIPYN